MRSIKKFCTKLFPLYDLFHLFEWKLFNVTNFFLSLMLGLWVRATESASGRFCVELQVFLNERINLFLSVHVCILANKLFVLFISLSLFVMLFVWLHVHVCQSSYFVSPSVSVWMCASVRICVCAYVCAPPIFHCLCLSLSLSRSLFVPLCLSLSLSASLCLSLSLWFIT